MHPRPLVGARLPAPVDVQVDPLGATALAGIDRAEPRDEPGPHRADRDLAGAVPGGVVERAGQRQAHGLTRRERGLGEDVGAVVAVGMLEGPVAVVLLDRQQRLDGVARGREEREIALRVEGAAGRLHDVLVDHVQRDEVDRAGGGKVAVLDVVGPLERLHRLHLRDQEVEVGVTLAVGVAAEVDGQIVDEQRDVGAVIGVEAAQEVLLGLAAALVLADDEARDQPQDLGGPSRREQLDVIAGDHHLRRGRGGQRRGDRHRRQAHRRPGRRLAGRLRGGRGDEQRADDEEARDPEGARHARQYHIKCRPCATPVCSPSRS